MYRSYVALRYLRKRPTALLAVLAVTFGVATLLTVLGIMEGYILRLRETIRDLDSHLTVISYDTAGFCDVDAVEQAVLGAAHVVAAAPTAEAIAMYRSERFNPCMLRGIDPVKELGVTAFDRIVFRPDELDGVLAPLLESTSADAAEIDRLRVAAEQRARALLAAPERQPISSDELGALFSLEWRRQLVARLPAGIRDRIQASRSVPSAAVVGLQFIVGGDLSPGQIFKVMTVKPGTSELAEGTFIVTGAFKSGNFDIDSNLFLIDNNRMGTLLGTFSPTTGQPCFDRLRVQLDDYRFADAARQDIKTRLDALDAATGGKDAIVLTWEDQKRNFLKAVAIEKWITGFVISLLNVFTGCIILLMLVLLVIEKTRDAGILLALGATPSGVLGIFLINGLAIAGIGTVSGLGAGLLFVGNINAIHDWIHATTGYRLFDPEVYQLDSIPVAITPADIVIAILPALLFGFLASLLPAVWAARKDPINAIHFE